MSPQKYMEKTCVHCGRGWMASKPESRTCSPKCRAILREQETPSPGKKRDYPSDVVELVVGLYADGLTVREIQNQIPRGVKVQTIVERYVRSRRKQGHRDQSGSKNACWKGDDIGYDNAHLRVKQLHGSAREHACIDCGGPAFDWSYSGGCPLEKHDPTHGCAYSPDPEMYKPRCRLCHKRYDLQLRKGADDE